jgi:hypothetical protein
MVPGIMARDPFDKLAQERSRAQAESERRVAREAFVNNVGWLMSSPEGRRFMAGLLGRTHVFQSSFTGNSETFFREGRRDVGLQYLAVLNSHFSEQYVLMLTEQNQNERPIAD